MPLTEQQAPPPVPLGAGRFDDGDPVDLRGRTARGVIVNAVFTLGVNAIWVIQGIALAAILPTAVYGDWGLLMAAFMTLLMLGSVGIDDKYIQQDDSDQQRAFEIAFTLQMLMGVVFVLVILVGMPLFALVYGRPGIAGPGIALAASVPAIALQMTIW